MLMKKETLKPFFVIGISVRTSNENGQAANDIPALWNRFRLENIGAKLINKTGDEVYSIYTDYEGDYTQPYTTILGLCCRKPGTCPRRNAWIGD